MLKNEKKIHAAFTKRTAPLLSFTALILAWELVVRFSGVNANVLPGPCNVLMSMTELITNGAVFKHTVASLFRVTVGFYLAALSGIPLGIILGRSRTAALLINPVIHFLRPISPLAWIPLAMLWFGIGDQPAVFLIFLSSEIQVSHRIKTFFYFLISMKHV